MVMCVTCLEKTIEVKSNGYLYISVSRKLAGKKYRVYYGLDRNIIILVSEDIEKLVKPTLYRTIKKLRELLTDRIMSKYVTESEKDSEGVDVGE